VATAFGLRACEEKIWAGRKKWRAVIGAANLPETLALIHGRGMIRHKINKLKLVPGGERRPHIEMMSGSRKRDAV
jgi:apolipoprotein N-acyltransferase